MKSTGEPRCSLWGVILSFTVTPLRWGFSGGLAPSSPEPRAPMGRQFTKPKTQLDSTGTLPTTDGEVLCNSKLAGNADKFWAHLGSSVDKGGGTRIRRYRGRPGGRTRQSPGHVSMLRTSGNEEELRSGWHLIASRSAPRMARVASAPRGP